VKDARREEREADGRIEENKKNLSVLTFCQR
jgi:hypothetical protein